ncbi:unnamed protein product [Kuraishia capsulata CBS 1993]|uniref:DNA polymerase epsilon subunit B n=1 Tax=Kuraishia capsulata CBS 1993 TaxID=1382522 RepID=W6MLZ0_9ASCO|nr:uncharacterized protein KUCA_T00003484001 [Kuraishia capsulata CBS 1993]CDK27506.1 unnamed protein product [Kuraishia capsulata CBS 1993]
MDPIVLPISLQPSNLRPIAYRILTKKYGLNIQSEALKRLTEVIGQRFGKDWRSPKSLAFLEKIGQSWKSQDLGVFLQSGDQLDSVIDQLTHNENASGRTDAGKVTKKAASLDELVATKMGNDPDSKSFEIYNSQADEEMEVPPEIDWKDHFKVVDAFRLPVYTYNYTRKQYEFVPSFNPLEEKKNGSIPMTGLLANVKSYADLFITRYKISSDRLLRNDNFQTSHGEKSTHNSITGSTTKSVAQVVTSIKNMLGRHGQHFLLFGLFTKSSDGFWQLQDDTGAIQLELNQCVFSKDCYFTPGCMLFCDGIYSNVGKFYASVMGHPPPEKRSISLDAHNIDFMKSGHATLPRIDYELQKRLKLMESENYEHRFVILGADCFLNDLKVLDGLKKVFGKLNSEVENDNLYDSLPLCIVLNGSFTNLPFTASAYNSSAVSSASTVSSSANYKVALDSLASILEKYPRLCQTATFVFIPGTNDPWSSISSKGSNVMWPQSGIPKVFGTKLNRLLKNCIWTSNPTKVSYLAHEITLVRDDIGEKLRRNDIAYLGKSEQDLMDESNEDQLEIDKLSQSPLHSLAPEVREARKIVKTVLDQAHLSPFVQSTRPILWNMDHVLQLLPLPNLLILTDASSPTFDVTYEGCHVINPGKFLHGSKCSYTEYFPSTKKAHNKHVFV